MLVGYARTSTADQVAGLEAQRRDLALAGVERVFEEQVSSVSQRAELENALGFVRDGDTFVVTKLDRLARSTADLLAILDQLERKGVGLRILNFGGSEVDTKSPTGKLMLTMFGAMAQFEREMMLERQREGIQKAKREGKYKGRKPTVRNRKVEIVELRQQGLGATEIARQLNIGRASVYRVLSD
ncbi:MULTISPECIES: recombinase family protein [Pelagibacterium]|uniref:Site-specific DNA recombinase n=2 Tax=Pelagibacterium TaxID=1082930 RepID=A0A1G7WP28_9HYPH|nr:MULTISPECIES: recombinase family protein [Pelagibacterium]UYQ72869.1 recombinase family protein [Pelagibacterium sp. YIM 151497]SDG73679.1 Site-specific DNA recombinase [Pelagibacterium luteolum]